MNVDLDKLFDSAVPEAKGKNARIISDNMTGGGNYRDANFLSKDFPRGQPKLFVTGENDDFDEQTLAEWRAEGFDVDYFSLESHPGNKYIDKLKSLSRGKINMCEKFGIVAYDKAAAECLKHYHVLDNNPEFKMGLLIAYYPTAIPDPKGRFPSAIEVLVHLAEGAALDVIKRSQMVGIQGKQRTKTSKVQRGLGTGGKLQLAFPSYSYEAEPGFAEHDMEEYDGISAELAWSRSLATARRTFGIDPDLELVLESNIQNKLIAPNTVQVLETLTTDKIPHVTNIPTLTGGIGAEELKRYYSEFFSNPPSSKVTLLTRTIGADRIVDEMHVQFKHTQEVSWILPGVPPTDKKVEILVVSIVTLKAGKIQQEHVYWDQASVLVQIGLLDPKLVPQAGKDLGVEKLPVVGKRAARHMLDSFGEGKEGQSDNKLIPGWRKKKGDKGQNGTQNGTEE